MRGIAHFATGVALSTLIPGVVPQAAAGGLLPVLGGIAGILPDTLDFKILRYFESCDAAVDPGPDPSASAVAHSVKAVIQDAQRASEPRTLRLHTVRHGPDLWRRYSLQLDAGSHDIAVKIGPLVSTAGAPVAGTEPDRDVSERIPSGVALAGGSTIEITVDAFSGPSVTFVPVAGRIEVRFLDWHRRWTHSVTFAVLLGLLTGAALAIIRVSSGGSIGRTPVLGGVVATVGVLGHIVEDQLGATGSNLFYPLTRRRTRGLGWIRSGDALSNFATVWLALAGVLLNLNRFATHRAPVPTWLWGAGVVAPLVLISVAYGVKRRRAPESPARNRAVDVLDELADGAEGWGAGGTCVGLRTTPIDRR